MEEEEEEEEEEEQHNVLREAIDAGLRSPGGREEGDKHMLEASGEMSFNLDNLPPPMTNFTSPMTPCPEPGLPSGLISGLSNSQSSGNGHVSFLLSGSSGPVGMQILEKSPITKPNRPIGTQTASMVSDSTPSLDLYSSGPALSSSSTGFPPVPEEHVQGQSVPKKGFEYTSEVASEIEQLSETWECSNCTYLVASHLEKCNICTEPRAR